MRQQDKARVVRAIPGVVRAAMRSYGSNVVLGGGFVRDVIMGVPPTDVDLFLARDVDAAGFASFLLSVSVEFREGAKRFDTENAITFRHWDARVLPYPIQVITRWRYERGVLAKADPGGEVAAFFDFTMAQACVWIEEAHRSSDRFGSFCSPDFYPDCAGKRLTYTSPTDDEAGGSLLRMRKFIARGWRISVDDMAGIYGVLAFRMFGEAVKSIEEAVESTRGLLRSIDPLPEDRTAGFDPVPDPHEPAEPDDDDEFPF